MVPVLPGLYLGGRGAEAPAGCVTALLSVDSEPPPEEEEAAAAGLEAVLHVQASDQPESDLLSHLDACAAFLDRARQRDGGGVALVRW